ncbi:unnamed protein product [Orchesella dallaii]|uniref:Uncharacterized protein n=1 Tax=Orchesella dallaii TaxID=48710 RepID=A0ABP1QEN0_9HEXA
MPPTAGGKKPSSGTGAPLDNRLPTCRNYWRFGPSVSTPQPQRPPAYLLKPHLIANSTASEFEGSNPNSKYQKLRHGPAAAQFSPMNEEILMMNYQYRVRLPFDPSPFRGVTRFAFWILFLSILVLLVVLITALLRVEDFHAHDHEGDHVIQQKLQEGDNHVKSLSDSIIFKTLTGHYHS